MKNILLFGDLHLTKQDIPECIYVLEEIEMLANQYNVDTVINLGDTFDSLKPSSQELDNFSTFIKGLNKKIIILVADSHESETTQDSIINHFGILSDNTTVLKEYQDGNHLLCLHEFIKENNINFGAKRSLKDFKQFKYVFSGHDHHHHIIKPNYCFLGSCRFINFDESSDKQKIVALIEDYKGEKEKIRFIALKSPYSMIDIILNSNKCNQLEEKDSKNSPSDALQDTILAKNEDKEKKDTLNPKSLISQAQNPPNLGQINEVGQLCSYLDQIPEKTKIRIIFKDYQNWVSFLPFYQKYKDKFVLFKDKKDFIIIANLTQEKKDNLSLKESLIKWIEINKINEKIKQILMDEISE